MYDVRQDPQLVERALLVAVEHAGRPTNETESLLEELEELVANIGVGVVDAVAIKARKPNPKYLIGVGQAADVMKLARAHNCDVIIFDEELTPAQQRNWEAEAKMLVIDRQEVIIDIFASRAQTKEAKLQVDLARMEYSLPRLRRAWTHLSRQRGGAATQRGEGETQLEIDQRLVRTRIARLKRELEQVIQHRKVQRAKRSKIPMPSAALIGYTNAGKSSLLNHMTESDVLEEDKVFATLDPTSKRLELPSGQTSILTDTVGFVRKLPHRLVDAFKATLEEAVIADMLIHVIDVSQPDLNPFINTTLNVLKELNADENPRLLVFNKTDLLEDRERIQFLQGQYPEAIFTSTKTGEGLEKLKEKLDEIFSESYRSVELVIPHSRYDLLTQLHETGGITFKQAIGEGTYVTGCIPQRLEATVLPFKLGENANDIRAQLKNFA
ncbi:MAG: GTPase HflX [Opitutales bacterium]|nr:GTPase HflX [Opitutales bacterium]